MSGAGSPEEALDGLRSILRGMNLEHEVGPDTHIRRDLDLDSLRRIELVIEVENRFRVRLEPEDEEDVETLGDLADVVRRRAGERGDDADA